MDTALLATTWSSTRATYCGRIGIHPGDAGYELVESFARLMVILQRAIEESEIGSAGQPRQQFPDGCRMSPTTPASTRQRRLITFDRSST